MPCLTHLTGSVNMDEEKNDVPMVEDVPDAIEAGCLNDLSKSGLPLTQLRQDLLDFLASNDKAHFKSLHKDDPELSIEQKRKIAENLLDHSPAQFLGRYGEFLLEEHLKYFSGEADPLKSESYEIEFHLRRLHRFYCKATNNVDVKNRRYDAMKKMIAKGSSYFTEDEMRQRNPYLYEQLVGQYLSEEERKERETPDLDNVSFVNLLLLKISRDETKELRKKQEDEEVENIEDSSASSDEHEEEDSTMQKNWNERGTWGETADDVTQLMNKRMKKEKKKKKSKPHSEEPLNEISDEERLLLMDEFLSTMYNSFIDGNDVDFDYSQVDNNPDYDCIDVRERDEEEKYFDAETPEDEEMEEVSDMPNTASVSELLPPPSLAEKRKAQEEEEDTLDAFMRTVVAPVQTSDLTVAFQNLCQQSASQRPELSRIVKKSHVIKINLKKD